MDMYQNHPLDALQRAYQSMAGSAVHQAPVCVSQPSNCASGPCTPAPPPVNVAPHVHIAPPVQIMPPQQQGYQTGCSCGTTQPQLQCVPIIWMPVPPTEQNNENKNSKEESEDLATKLDKLIELLTPKDPEPPADPTLPTVEPNPQMARSSVESDNPFMRSGARMSSVDAKQFNELDRFPPSLLALRRAVEEFDRDLDDLEKMIRS